MNNAGSMVKNEEKQLWVQAWPVGSHGLHKVGRGWIGVTVTRVEWSHGWPILVLKDELGGTRYCSFGHRYDLQAL